MSGVVIKREPQPVSEPQGQIEKKISEGRKYAVLAPESVKIIAETCGITGLNQDVASTISQDVSFRLNEVIHHCSTFLRQSKRKILLATDIVEAFKDFSIPPLYGHLPSIPAPYRYIQEADVFIDSDNIVNLHDLVFRPEFLAQRGDAFVKETWMRPVQEPLKSDSQPFIKKEPCDSESSSSVTEQASNAIQIPPNLLSYYNHVASVILGSNEKQFKVVLADLKSNDKIGLVVPYLFNAIVLGMQKFPRQRGRLLQVINALLPNPCIPFKATISVHRVISALLMCALEQNVAEGTPPVQEYKIRSDAAITLGKVVSKWYNKESKLRIDIIQKVGIVLYNGTSSIRSHYGALVLLIAIGGDALEFCLWPHLGQYLSFLQTKSLHAKSSVKAQNDYWDVKQLEGAILNAAEVMYRRELADISQPSTLPQSIASLDRMLSSYFGDALCARCPRSGVSTFEMTNNKKIGGDGRHEDDIDIPKWTAVPKSPSRHTPLLFNKKNVSGLKRSNPQGEGSLGDHFDLPDAKKRQIDAIQMNFAGGKPVSKQQLLRRCADSGASPTKIPSVYYRKSCEVGCIGKSTFKRLPKHHTSLGNACDILLSVL